MQPNSTGTVFWVTQFAGNPSITFRGFGKSALANADNWRVTRRNRDRIASRYLAKRSGKISAFNAAGCHNREPDSSLANAWLMAGSIGGPSIASGDSSVLEIPWQLQDANSLSTCSLVVNPSLDITLGDGGTDQ